MWGSVGRGGSKVVMTLRSININSAELFTQSPKYQRTKSNLPSPKVQGGFVKFATINVNWGGSVAEPGAPKADKPVALKKGTSIYLTLVYLHLVL